MMTYSINTSTKKEAVGYKISGTPSYFDEFLNILYDNKVKAITPHELRDVMLSLWDDVIFKQTTATGPTALSTEYIGIDAGNPSNRDVKRKFFLGKRAYSGTFSYNDSHSIMGLTTSLLSNDVDTYFYNTKGDNFEQVTTKIKILSGTNFGIFENMPYIQSQYVSGNSYSLSLDFINSIGDINIKSDTSTVSISQISFPSISESVNDVAFDRVLKWNNSNKKLYWDDIFFPPNSAIGSSGVSLQVFGDPILINDYPIEFSDDRMSTVQFGDIQYGDTFENISLSEMLKRIVYQYLPPGCSIKLDVPYTSGYVEVGTSPTPNLLWEINKKSQDLSVTTLTNMIPGVYSPIVSDEYVNIFGSSSGIVISPITASTTRFKITVNDGTSIVSASTSITGIYPYFSGFSDLGVMTVAGLASLNKIIEPKANKLLDFTGTGNLYYIYPKIYGTLSSILDTNGNNYLSSGTFSGPSVRVFNSPAGVWSSVEYYVYQWNNASIGPPSVNYQFKH